MFLGNARGALIVALTIPFSLLFACICLSLIHVPANLLSLGALDFGMVVGRRGGDGGEHRGGIWAASARPEPRWAPYATPRMRLAAAGVLLHRHHHQRRTCRSSTLQRVEGRLFKPWHGRYRSRWLGSLLFSMIVAPVVSSLFFRQARARVAQPGDGLDDAGIPSRPSLAIRLRWLTPGGGGGGRGPLVVSHFERHHRLGIPARTRRGRYLGASYAGRRAPDLPKARRVMDQARVILASSRK